MSYLTSVGQNIANLWGSVSARLPALPSLNLNGASIKAAGVGAVRFAAAPAIFVAQQFTKVRPVTPQLAILSAVVWAVAIAAIAFKALRKPAAPGGGGQQAEPPVQPNNGTDPAIPRPDDQTGGQNVNPQDGQNVNPQDGQNVNPQDGQNVNPQENN